MNSWIPELSWRWYRQAFMPVTSGTTDWKSWRIWSRRDLFSFAIEGGRGWFSVRTLRTSSQYSSWSNIWVSCK